MEGCHNQQAELVQALKAPSLQELEVLRWSVRNYVTKQMNLINTTVSHDIAYAFGMDPILSQSAATTSLISTITFLTQ